jgi:hypothetical protein
MMLEFELIDVDRDVAKEGTVRLSKGMEIGRWQPE